MQVRRLVEAHTDLAIALALGISMAIELALRQHNLAALAVAVLGCLPLALRRTMPVIGFVLTWLGTLLILQFVPNFDEVSVTFLVAYFLSLYSLGAYARGREQPISVLLVIVGIIFFVANDGDPFAIGDVMFALFFVGGPWAAGLAIQLRQSQIGELHEQNVRLQLEQEELTRRAIAAERATIARELHDVVSHAISVTVLQARGARQVLTADEAAVRSALDAIESTNTAALSDMRRLLAVLRDTEPEQPGPWNDHAPQPSLAHLDGLLEQVRKSGIDVGLEIIGEPHAMPPGVDLSAYRIIQEALTNVLKHAHACVARIQLSYGDETLELSVVDDGQTSVEQAAFGHGLIGIRERVAVVGGRVETGPGPDGGFEVRARLPYALETP